MLQGATLETMTGQRMFSPALRAVIRTGPLWIDHLVEVIAGAPGKYVLQAFGGQECPPQHMP